MKADKGRRQRCRRIRPGSPGVAQAPIDGVSNCSRAMPATSTSGRAARSDSAPPSDACTSGSLQTAILLHVGRPPDRIAAAGRRKRLPRCHTGDAGTDSQRANQNRRGNGRKKANRTGGCKERLRRRRRNVSITHRSRKRVLRRPWSLLRPPPRAPERNRPESSADSPVRCPWARAATRWRSPNQASFPSRIGTARIKPFPPPKRGFSQESLASMSSHMLHRRRMRGGEGCRRGTGPSARRAFRYSRGASAAIRTTNLEWL
jgi:hypothetical protein